ncbi:UNVERIFIED_CONTAM: hypothetical protein Slati_0513500 [Sesamum latifolium]|uniref:Reverse transcriptase zinc-binding domain-containing protein n=1 Tax=Sesamum latifolium TaxID=2727402 RepID=A0AAW2XXK9_9LAMI
MVVSGAIGEQTKRVLAERLGVRLMSSHDCYLGLPAVAGRSRIALFQNIDDCFWSRINGWNNKLLSQAGKGADSATRGESTLMWRPSKKGIFSVKSAYEVSLSLEATRPFPQLAEGCEHFWGRMWALVMSPQVRVRAWRFCYEAVPSIDNLSKRKVVVETRCVICDAEVEMLQHILLERAFARVVWLYPVFLGALLGARRRGLHVGFHQQFRN